MKLAIKLALVGSGLLAAGSAMATITPITNNTGGELFLVVLDASQGQAYVRGLGVTMNQLATEGEGAGQLNAAQTGPTIINAPAALTAALSIGPDSNLTTFLGLAGAKTYMIVAGNTSLNSTLLSDGLTKTDAYISTSAKPIFNGGTYVSGAVSVNTVASSYAGIAANVTAANNAILAAHPGSTAGDTLSTSSSALYSGTGGFVATSSNLSTWFGKGFGAAGSTNVPTIALGSSGDLYAAATNIAGAGAGPANLWDFGTVTLSTSGALSFVGNTVAAVPLPAAAWLLASSLLGLVGVGRRRRAA